jgi:hypothetical protein
MTEESGLVDVFWYRNQGGQHFRLTYDDGRGVWKSGNLGEAMRLAEDAGLQIVPTSDQSSHWVVNAETWHVAE